MTCLLCGTAADSVSILPDDPAKTTNIFWVTGELFMESFPHGQHYEANLLEYHSWAVSNLQNRQW